MASFCNFLRSTTLAGLSGLLVLPAMGATSSADRETQMLANFPALRRLSAGKGDGAVHAYLVRVAKSYQAAGYKAFASELPKTDRVVALFGEPERAKDAATLAEGRKTLRDLEQALSKNAFLALPVTTGKNVPDYFDIGRAFLANAQGALKNLRQGKNVGNFLRSKTATFWVSKQDDNTWQVVSSNAGVTLAATLSFTAGGTLNMESAGNSLVVAPLVTVGGGSLVLTGANTYTGSTMISGGTLTSVAGNVGVQLFSGIAQITGSDPLSIDPSLIKSGAGTLTLTGSDFYNGNTTIGSGNLTIAGGTLGTGTITILTRGSLTISSGDVFLPETDFANAGLVKLAGGNLTVTGTTGTHWIALASGAALPDGQCGAVYFALNASYTVNNVDLPSGTAIYRVDDGFVTPDGATELPDAALTAVPLATPTPTPTPSPTP